MAMQGKWVPLLLEEFFVFGKSSIFTKHPIYGKVKTYDGKKKNRKDHEVMMVYLCEQQKLRKNDAGILEVTL